MAEDPTPIRDPRTPHDPALPHATTAHERAAAADRGTDGSKGGWIPWLLLALGVLALLLWLFGAFDGDTETVVTPTTTVEEPAVATPAPEATPETADDAVVVTPVPTETVPAETTDDATPAPTDGAATDDATTAPATQDGAATDEPDGNVTTTEVPITPVDPEAPATTTTD